MLCPGFFDLKALGDIPTPRAGTKLDAQVNQGMVLLHELMHILDPNIVGMLHYLVLDNVATISES